MDELLLPLFPLEVVLMPEEPLPLHIFEERYRVMIGECLDAKAAGSEQQVFGIVLAKDQEMRTVGCSARIVNLTRKYEDGRMDILTVGKRRFEILYTNEERLYLRSGVEFFEDEAGADTVGDEEAARAIDLFRQVMQRMHKSTDMPIHFPQPYRYLSFRMAAPLPLDLDFKQQLLTVRNEAERLHQVTRVMDLLMAQLELVEKARSKAGGNGDILKQARRGGQG